MGIAERERDGHYLMLKNISAKGVEPVKLSGEMTDYSDSFSTKYTATSVYGRMDPIQTYSGTERTISISIC